VLRTGVDAALLDGVRDLVRDQVVAGVGAGVVLTSTEVDVLPVRKGEGAE
jgi:hypothetical protein